MDVMPTLRWMLPEDMPNIISIERSSFDSPWKESDFRDYLSAKGAVGLAGEVDGNVICYVVYSVGDGYVEIVNIAVAEAYRRQGIGTMMLDKIKSKLRKSKNRTQVKVNVADFNLAGQMLFKSAGFKAVAVFEEHFVKDDGNRVDAYMFTYEKPAPIYANRISQYYCEESEK